MAAILSVKDLTVRFSTPEGEVSAVSRLNFDIEEGDCVGVVGEWSALGNKLETPVTNLNVKKGDTIDFMVDCRTNPNNDSFQ